MKNVVLIFWIVIGTLGLNIAAAYGSEDGIIESPELEIQIKKWVDFTIIRVRYDSERQYITFVEYRANSGEGLQSETIQLSRRQVVTSIEQGSTFGTAIKNSAGEWVKGAKVHIFTRDGNKFIRTDRNDTSKDNLGELPAF